MIFLEEIIKELEEAEKEELSFQEQEVFTLGKEKKMSGYGIAIPLILISCYEIFAAFFTKKYYILVISAALFYAAFRQLKNMRAYKIYIRTRNSHFLFQNVDIDLKNLESLQLREAKLGKKVVPALDFITKEKKQMILPMYMDRQVFMIRLLKFLLGERFSIKK